MNESNEAGIGSAADGLTRIGILTTDSDLVVQSWDPTLERLTGIPADAARGRRLDELVPDLHDRVPPSLLREPMVSGSPQVLAPAIHKFLIPCRPLEPSGEFDQMQQRVVVGALRDDDRLVGLVISVEDVTARLDAERRLGRQLKDADPAARADAVRQLAAVEPTEGLGPLASAIGDEEWHVRRAAVRAIASRRNAALVDAVVNALRDGHRDFSLISSALQLLSLTGVDVTDALVGLLHHKDATVRVQASLALGTQPRPEAVTALIGALDDPDPNVQFHAIEALGRLAAPAAIDRLATIVETRDFYLAFPAIEALVRINDPLIAPRLVPLLSDALLAGPAADALGRIGDEDVIVPLVKALDEAVAPVTTIVDALASIHTRYQTVEGGAELIEDLVRRTLTQSAVRRVLQELGRVSGSSLKHLVVVVGWMRDPGVPAALARLLGSADVHREVVEAMVRFGPAAVDLLIDALGVDELDVKRSAVVALGRLGERSAVGAISRLFADEDNRELWPAAAGALSQLGDERAFEPLVALLGDRDAAVRQAAVGALNSIGHHQTASRVRELLDHPNPFARESAVKIAGYFGYVECVDAVLARCRDEDDAVSASALEHLPYFDDPRTVDALASRLNDGTPRVRAAAAQALAVVVCPRARLLLEAAADDQEPWVRYFAAGGLGRHGDASALPRLMRLALSDSAHQVSAAAIDAVASIGGDDAVAILEPLAASDDERGQAAVRALGKTRSARAIRVLQHALRSTNARRRFAAVEALAASRSPEAIETLQWTASGDRDRDVARAAIAGLGELSSQPAPLGRQAVRSLVSCLSEPLVNAEALARLARLSPAAIPWLADELNADDPRVRRGVIEALGRIPHPAASACLQHALADSDAVVRRQAVAALSRMGTRGVSRMLSQLARMDPSPVVRQAAAAALHRQSPAAGAE